MELKWGEIKIQLRGLDMSAVERYRRNIEDLTAYGVFEIANGKATLNFDKDKNLMNIKIETEPYKRKKKSGDKNA